MLTRVESKNLKIGGRGQKVDENTCWGENQEIVRFVKRRERKSFQRRNEKPTRLQNRKRRKERKRGEQDTEKRH
jgi:hypothetical protein